MPFQLNMRIPISVHRLTFDPNGFFSGKVVVLLVVVAVGEQVLKWMDLHKQWLYGADVWSKHSFQISKCHNTIGLDSGVWLMQ